MFVPLVPSSVHDFRQCWICVFTFKVFVVGMVDRTRICLVRICLYNCVRVVKQDTSRLGRAGNAIGDEVVELVTLLACQCSQRHRGDFHTCGMITSPRTHNRSSTPTLAHSLLLSFLLFALPLPPLRRPPDTPSFAPTFRHRSRNSQM